MGQAALCALEVPQLQIDDRLVITGTGRWAGDNVYVIDVVSIDQNDDSIKVQYADGGLKRFHRPDLERRIVSGERATEALRVHQEALHKMDTATFQVGDSVFLNGTGRWAGSHHKAAIVDVRDSDHSIKVKFLDGRMKRYSLLKFMHLLGDETMADSCTVFEGLSDKDLEVAFSQSCDIDGYIGAMEIKKSLENLGQACSLKQAYELINSAKSDGKDDNRLDFEDYRVMVRAHEKQCRLLWDLIQSNTYENKLDLSKKHEISHSFRSIFGSQYNSEAFTDMLQTIDGNNDGFITFKEFQKAMLWSMASSDSVLKLVDNALSFVGYSDAPASLPAWKMLSAGFIAGAISRTATHPMERTSLVMRAQAGQPGAQGVVGVITGLAKSQGIQSLWRGNGTNICQVGPESALGFFFYDALKNAFVDDPSAPGPFEKFACGSMSGAMANTCVYPISLTGARLAVAPQGTYAGLLDCMRKTYLDGGALTFYRGYLANLARILPSKGMDMTLFNTLREHFVPRGEQITAMQGLAFGGISSLVATTISYPMLLARTKLQTQGLNGAPMLYKNFIDAMKKTVYGDAELGLKAGGFRGLYSGLPPCLMKFVPATSIQFMVYTQLLTQMQ